MKTGDRSNRALCVALLVTLAVGACRKGERLAHAPKVGDSAPSFAVRPVSREGVSRGTLSLEALRGKTVVLAFFPKAGTPGCTTQMTAYRDRYAKLFHGGKNVVLLAASTDKEGRLEEWAKTEGFPFLFVSDTDGALGAKFGALDKGDWWADRVLYVIAPDGRISYKATPFRQSSEEAYQQLGAAIDQVTPQ